MSSQTSTSSNHRRKRSAFLTQVDPPIIPTTAEFDLEKFLAERRHLSINGLHDELSLIQGVLVARRDQELGQKYMDILKMTDGLDDVAREWKQCLVNTEEVQSVLQVLPFYLYKIINARIH